MAVDSRVSFKITDNDWNLIALDPDTDGYTKMLIDQINTNQTETSWSTLNTTLLPTSKLPNETAVFNYDIYVKNVNATAEKPVVLSITRLS